MRKIIAVSFAALVMCAFALGLLAQEKPAVAPSKVTGLVVNEADKPVANAEVRIYSLKQRDKKPLVLRTDKAGKVTFDHPTEGSAIYALAPGLTCRSEQYWPGRKDAEVKFTLRPGSKLKGVVVDENGKPLEGAQVKFERCYVYGSGVSGSDREVQLPQDLGNTKTGKNGAFVFDHMPSQDSEYMDASLEVEAPGRALIDVSANKQDIAKGLKITDPLECKIDGTLYLPGKTGVAPEGTELYAAVTSGNTTSYRHAQVDKSGRFHFVKLPPGDHPITLASVTAEWTKDGPKYTPHPWALTAKRVKLAPKQTASVDLELVTGSLISGKVIDKKTQQPIKGARLAVFHAGRPSQDWGEDYEANATGEFQVRVPPGDVRIAIQSIQTADQYVYFQEEDRVEVSIVAADGEDKSDVAVVVDPAARTDYSAANKPVPADFELKRGTYELTWDDSLKISDRSYGQGKYRDEGARSRIKVMPKTECAEPKCMALSFDSSGDEGLLYVVFDRSKGLNAGWDKVFVDKNRNGDMTDDGGPVALPGRSMSRKVTVWFIVEARQGTAEGEQAQNPYQVRLAVYAEAGPYVSVERKGAWTGKVDSNKGPVDCAILDRNTNGVFCDIEKGGLGDIVLIDDNGCGSLAGVDYGPQAITLYKLCQVGRKFYMITPTALGSKVTIEPYAGPMGQILASGKSIQGLKPVIQNIALRCDNGLYSFSSLDGKPIDIPVGIYAVSSCGLSLGDKLPMSCSLSSKVAVVEAKCASVDVGGPLKMSISKSEKTLYYRAGTTETLSWDITLGDKFKADSFGGEIAPKVRFLDMKGRQVGATRANYT